MVFASNTRVLQKNLLKKKKRNEVLWCTIFADYGVLVKEGTNVSEGSLNVEERIKMDWK